MNRNVLVLSMLLFCVLLFTSCQGSKTEASHGEVTLTLNLSGTNSAAKTLVNLGANEHIAFNYRVFLDGAVVLNIIEKIVTADGVILRLPVAAGNHTIAVKAYGDSAAFTPAFPAGTSILRAEGKWYGLITIGMDVPIAMTSAMEAASWSQLVAAIGTGSPSGKREEIIYLSANTSSPSDAWNATYEIQILRSITLIAVDSVEITRNFGAALGDHSLFYIDYSGSLSLGGKLTLNGNNDSASNSALVYVDGILNMESEVTLWKNKNNKIGGAVYINDGIFNMNGGAIRNNTAREGGGVYVSSSGTFTMRGGNIMNNDSRAITGSLGGGVVVAGNFDMYAGNISSNAADTNGGGVYVKDRAVFTMYSGTTIRLNEAIQNGGGVYVFTSGEFNMEGGDISGNSAYGDGGGVFCNGFLNMLSGAVIDNNSALSSGGGVHIAGSGIFEMTGSSITRNVSGASGGGVDVYGKFTMDGGIISNNSANINGGGVYLFGASARFAMFAGTIGRANTAYSGGGVYADAASTFTMSDGNITGNNAAVSGGGVYYNHSPFTPGGTVNGNSPDNVAP